MKFQKLPSLQHLLLWLRGAGCTDRTGQDTPSSDICSEASPNLLSQSKCCCYQSLCESQSERRKHPTKLTLNYF